MSETLQRILELIRELPNSEREQAAKLILDTLAELDAETAWATEIERRRQSPGDLRDARLVLEELNSRSSSR